MSVEQKYAKLVDVQSGLVCVGLGDDSEQYAAMGMAILEVEQAKNGSWYLSGRCPAPTLEDQLAAIEAKYAPKIAALRDGIMSAYLTDGAIMDDNVSGLRTEWSAVIAQRNAEMEALLI